MDRSFPDIPRTARAYLRAATLRLANHVVSRVSMRPFLRPIYHILVDGWGLLLADVDRTLKRIRRLGEDAWAEQWAITGHEYLALAAQYEQANQTLSATEAYWHAALAFHAGDYILGANDPQKWELYRQSVHAYARFAALSTPPVERISLNTPLGEYHGYLHFPATTGPFPCVVVIHGLGSTKEQPDFPPHALTRRGFAAFVTDMPGHGEAYPATRLTIDSYTLILHALDWLKQHPAIVPSQLALLGTSLGGTIALRAASASHTILRGVVNISGFYEPRHWFEKSAHLTEAALKAVTGISNSADLRQLISQFTLRGAIAKIRCPILSVHGDADIIVPADEARLIHQEASANSTLRIFPGGDHALLNTPEARYLILNWLTTQLRLFPHSVPNTLATSPSS